MEKNPIPGTSWSTTHQGVLETKRVFYNRVDERGIVIQNKERVVAKWYSHEEETDIDETFYYDNMLIIKIDDDLVSLG